MNRTYETPTLTIEKFKTNVPIMDFLGGGEETGWDGNIIETSWFESIPEPDDIGLGW